MGRAAQFIREMYGSRLKVIFRLSDNGRNFSRSFPALLSKNTRKAAGEHPYRMTLFSRRLTPLGHVDFGRVDARRLEQGVLSHNVKSTLVMKYNRSSPVGVQYNPVRDVEVVPVEPQLNS